MAHNSKDLAYTLEKDDASFKLVPVSAGAEQTPNPGDDAKQAKTAVQSSKQADDEIMQAINDYRADNPHSRMVR